MFSKTIFYSLRKSGNIIEEHLKTSFSHTRIYNSHRK